MIAHEDIGRIAQLIGEQSRATMLWHLLGDSALSATELAMCADISPQSASMHLHKLVHAGLLVVEKRGRHRYYRFSRPEVAYAIEALASLLPGGRSDRSGLVHPVGDIRYCRTCYNHLAGRMGVLLTEHLQKHKIILRAGSQFTLTQDGVTWFESLGIVIADVRKSRSLFAKACLDWSERRYHLAGALGAALLNTMVESDWVRRVENSRAVIPTPKGRRQLFDQLGLNV